MNKYLATDLDGTLMYPILKTKYVSKENKEVIEYFQKNVIIVSGRNQKFIKNVCKEIGINQTFIACNGASIYLNGEEIYSFYIKTSIIKEIINYVSETFKKYKIILFDNHSNLYALTNDIKQANIEEKEWKKKYPKHGYITNKNTKKINEILKKENSIIKLNVVLEQKDKIKLYEYLLSKNYKLSYSICIHSLEITDTNVNKGNSLIKLMEYMNLNKNDIIVAGDDKNDISMFEKFDNSFLIKHASNRDLRNTTLYVISKFKEIIKYISED